MVHHLDDAGSHMLYGDYAAERRIDTVDVSVIHRPLPWPKLLNYA